MNRLRNQLIAAFFVATLVPLAATVLIVTSLLERSLSYATTEELDRLSESLHRTGLEYYQQACEALKADAKAGIAPPQILTAAGRNNWPPSAGGVYRQCPNRAFRTGGHRGNGVAVFRPARGRRLGVHAASRKHSYG